MRAVFYYGPGDLRLQETPVPSAGAGEVVVKIHTALTCGTDFKACRQGHPVLISRAPSPFGHEMAGTICEVGEGVTALQQGDRVVVLNSAPCNRCYFCARGTPELCDNLELLNGAYADYIRVPAHITRQNVHRIADAMDFSVAALAEPFACALHAVDRMQLQPGDTVALIGSGNMGRLLICALKRVDARVLVVGRNAGRLELAKAAGADEVLDLTREPDGAAAVRARTEGRGADGVIEAVGQAETWALSVAMARRGGQVCLFGGCAKGTTIELDAHQIHYGELRIFGVFHHRPNYVRQALDLLGKGVVPPALLIDQNISLEEVPSFFAANSTTSVLKAAVVM